MKIKTKLHEILSQDEISFADLIIFKGGKYVNTGNLSKKNGILEYNRDYTKSGFFFWLAQDKKYFKLTWIEHLKFLWLLKKHWFQKEENIRYIINLLFLISGLILAWIKI